MGINCHEFLEYVIQPTLKQLGVDSAKAAQLLLATACHQSEMGHHLQRSDGIGIYGITAEMHQDVWDNYLAMDCELASQIRGMASQHEFPKSPHSELVTNLLYATAIAWMIYRHKGIKLNDDTSADDLTNLWQRCFMDRPISFKERDEFTRCCAKFAPSGKKSIAA
ncbi:MAG: hypothetical protein CMK83_14065 [Pseudomonadales bacterium]|jgi:hypothetical protein|uniref:hypothetical protein n=1 Tax=unclassified Ketobacter TaxID=2639109 RepID=UPI000C4D644A|nr:MULTISPECIES: hypothetical protein [unclassified Ketobacter]MAA60514.1 hypothetical protein [Pseudomonadales bacterium]MEC8811230.1 hypothetical protein [Pseudomonadota bacterium]TNC89078.1 MAG: hypothetical protein CSH49_08935 [Alcanivorax sp.]HAG95990.1 hypothetical protein [Gammaproteobacteria bacterium]MAQ25329.1 hypothetical protein [Pseudomonadales bacterium]|tara:strand:+ start:2266 stop:2763 length:498 start_codon:yes stop_codon:yes gene_type:complete